MFTIKRETCTNKGDDSKFIFARIMPLFGLIIFRGILIFYYYFSIPLFFLNSNVTRSHTFKIKKAAKAKRWHPHAVLLLLQSCLYVGMTCQTLISYLERVFCIDILSVNENFLPEYQIQNEHSM